jgi:hypothetical protein
MSSRKQALTSMRLSARDIARLGLICAGWTASGQEALGDASGEELEAKLSEASSEIAKATRFLRRAPPAQHRNPRIKRPVTVSFFPLSKGMEVAKWDRLTSFGQPERVPNFPRCRNKRYSCDKVATINVAANAASCDK